MMSSPSIHKEWTFTCPTCNIHQPGLKKKLAESILRGHMKSEQHYMSEEHSLSQRHA